MSSFQLAEHGDNVLTRCREYVMNIRQKVLLAMVGVAMILLPTSQPVAEEIHLVEMPEINVLAGELEHRLWQLGGYLWFFDLTASLSPDGSMYIEKKTFVEWNGRLYRCLVWYVMESEQPVFNNSRCTGNAMLSYYPSPEDLLNAITSLVRVARTVTGDPRAQTPLVSGDVTLRPKAEKIIARVEKEPGLERQYDNVNISIAQGSRGKVLQIRVKGIPISDPTLRKTCEAEGTFTYNQQTRVASSHVICTDDPDLRLSDEDEVGYLIVFINRIIKDLEKEG